MLKVRGSGGRRCVLTPPGHKATAVPSLQVPMNPRHSCFLFNWAIGSQSGWSCSGIPHSPLRPQLSLPDLGGCRPSTLMLHYGQRPRSRYQHHHGCFGFLLLPHPRSALLNVYKAQLQSPGAKRVTKRPYQVRLIATAPNLAPSFLCTLSLYLFIFAGLLIFSCCPKAQRFNTSGLCGSMMFWVPMHCSEAFQHILSGYGLSPAYLLPRLHHFKCFIRSTLHWNIPALGSCFLLITSTKDIKESKKHPLYLHVRACCFLPSSSGVGSPGVWKQTWIVVGSRGPLVSL